MSKKISIAIDAMGGDNSPDKTIEGVKIFLNKHKSKNDFILNIFGKESLINEKIKRYLENKKNTQPSQIKTCGSTFKNPKNKKAWKLIKDSNCNFLSFGKASISKKHCNFFVNEGGASSKDIEKLIESVRQKVLEKQNVNLELELKIIGETNNNG